MKSFVKYAKSVFGGFTMYRSILYYLLFLVAAAIFLSAFSILPYDPISLAATAFFLCVLSYFFNFVCAKLFRTKPNLESQFITALILALIVGPVDFGKDVIFLTILALISQASKYVIAYRKRHILNPAAAAVLISAIVIQRGASWWVGSLALVPFVILGGLIMTRKIRRFKLAGIFIGAYVALIVGDSIFQGATISHTASLIRDILFFSPLLFFSFVMLVEPLTSPPLSKWRNYYGALVALCLFAFQKWLNVPYGLELALITGNIFTRIVNPDLRLALRLIKKEKLSESIYAFSFEPQKKFGFVPGQFFELTLPHDNADSRGVRRWFTISSSPTEQYVEFTTKFAEKGSTFKQKLRNMREGEEIIVSGLGGDFTLPKNLAQPMVFIAGGIGITPFRSMIQHLLDRNLTTDIVLLYSNRTVSDIVFKDVLDRAEKKLGLKTVYTMTDAVPESWKGRTGFIDETLIGIEIPDYRNRLFYVSGPEPMAESSEKMLAGMGISPNNIKRDYFPGYTDAYRPI